MSSVKKQRGSEGAAIETKHDHEHETKHAEEAKAHASGKAVGADLSAAEVDKKIRSLFSRLKPLKQRKPRKQGRSKVH
jgi:hypothetical protein